MARLARVGTGGFGVAVGLILLAFLTNIQPFPYYEWATLPTTVLPSQPRLGHYPVSLTLGLWLWEFTFPFVLIWIADRYALGSKQGRALMFILVPAIYALAFHLYCRFIFPQPDPTAWEPAVTVVCYFYCQTYTLSWSYITIGTAILGLLVAATPAKKTIGWYALVVFGILTFPLGIAPLYEAAVRRERSSHRASIGNPT